MFNNKRAAQPGDLAKDIVTGFAGIITSRTTWLHGCDRITITPNKLGSDGSPIKEETFDEQRIEVIKRGKVKAKQPDPEALLPLGAEAKDTITGFTGIIGALIVTIGGTVYIQIEPEKLKKEGQPFEAEAFNAERIEVIKPKPVPRAKKTKTSDENGGPQRGEGARRHG